jgi:hypothetical protein
MPRRKFKLTGFARFFIAMLFLAPLAYIGASYYNGEDGVENIKNFFKKFTGGETNDNKTKSIDSVDSSKGTQSEEDLLEEKRRLEEEIRKKNKQIEDLNKKLEEE